MINLKKYLEETKTIDFSNPLIKELAFNLSKDCNSDIQIAKNCFLYVRDEISHSGDIKADITTSSASEVLKYKTGWCYAKAFLLAALLRANGIPTGFCYQRLSCGEYKDDIYCLHGLNAIYLKDYGWYKIDARGNKEGVDAKFTPPLENLAFKLEEGEYDLAEIYDKPLEVVMNSLKNNNGYEQMMHNFPITNEYIRKVKIDDADELSNLVTTLLPYIFTQTPTWFKENISKGSFENRIKNDTYNHFIYTIDNKIVGFIVIKNKTYLYHLFVDSSYHKKGIAKKLFECVKTNMDVENMEVNASLYSVDAYKALGFEIDGKKSSFKELEYQPMVYRG